MDLVHVVGNCLGEEKPKLAAGRQENLQRYGVCLKFVSCPGSSTCNHCGICGCQRERHPYLANNCTLDASNPNTNYSDDCGHTSKRSHEMHHNISSHKQNYQNDKAHGNNGLGMANDDIKTPQIAEGWQFFIKKKPQNSSSIAEECNVKAFNPSRVKAEVGVEGTEAIYVNSVNHNSVKPNNSVNNNNITDQGVVNLSTESCHKMHHDISNHKQNGHCDRAHGSSGFRMAKDDIKTPQNAEEWWFFKKPKRNSTSIAEQGNVNACSPCRVKAEMEVERTEVDNVKLNSSMNNNSSNNNSSSSIADQGKVNLSRASCLKAEFYDENRETNHGTVQIIVPNNDCLNFFGESNLNRGENRVCNRPDKYYLNLFSGSNYSSRENRANNMADKDFPNLFCESSLNGDENRASNGITSNSIDNVFNCSKGIEENRRSNVNTSNTIHRTVNCSKAFENDHGERRDYVANSSVGEMVLNNVSDSSNVGHSTQKSSKTAKSLRKKLEESLARLEQPQPSFDVVDIGGEMKIKCAVCNKVFRGDSCRIRLHKLMQHLWSMEHLHNAGNFYFSFN